MRAPGRLLWIAGGRSWRRHPLQLALAVLGVALGVAVATSVQLANTSALRAFRISTEAVTGPVTHQIVAGSEGVPETLIPELRVQRGLRAAPVVEGWLATADGATVRLLGIDPLLEADLRGYFAGRGFGGSIDVATLFTVPGSVAVTAATAADLGVAPGSGLTVLVEGSTVELRVVEILEPGGGLPETGLRGTLIADVATAQEVLGRIGRLSRIDLVLGPDDPPTGTLRESLPAPSVLVEAGARAETTLEMTRSFRLNLTAMSLLALVCGLFLIYNTVTFSVVRRREQIGLLRSLGVTRREIFTLVLGEAGGIAVAGTVLGLAGGLLLARGMVHLVTRTVNDLYFTVTVRSVSLDPRVLAAFGLIGVGATLLAALPPAREATRARPRTASIRSGIESRARRLAPVLALLGAAVAVGGALLLVVFDGLLPAFIGLFALLLAAALMTPAATLAIAGMLRGALAPVAGALGSLAARGVTANLSRTAVAVAALMVAVSVIIGVGTMVASFRASLVDWLGYTLQADVYVNPVGSRGAGDRLEIPAGLRRQLEGDPRVRGVGTVRRLEVETLGGPVQILVVEPGPDGPAGYSFVEGEGEVAWRRFEAGEVLVSEPYAHRTGATVGSILSLPTPSGPVELEVVGVTRSYVSDQGAIMLHRDRYRELWRDETVSGLSVYLADPGDLEEIRERLADAFVGRQRVSITSNAQLRLQTLSIFDRTFLITAVLRFLVSLVAFVGVFSALTAMSLERARELGILRANGLTPLQLLGLVIGQTGILGTIAGVLALPLGIVLAWIMIHVINRRSFGWSLQMHLPPDVLVEAVAIAIGAALLAGVLPAIRSARGVPAPALREE